MLEVGGGNCATTIIPNTYPFYASGEVVGDPREAVLIVGKGLQRLPLQGRGDFI